MNFREILIRIIGMTTPYVYDNNISLLELVRRLYKFVNELATCVQDLDKEFTDLKEYVNNYFDNLDISSEIKTVLNEMIEDGTLANIINDELLGNINNEITSINETLETVNSTLQAHATELNYLTYRDRFQVATCSANSNYAITNSNFTIQNDDVIFIHFNEALDGTKDATLTINGIAKSVITKEGALYKGSDIQNQDIILRVTDAGLIQVVDILYFQEQINDNKEDIAELQTDVTNMFKTLKPQLIDLFLPVGFIIYTENDSYDPNTVYTGTTWQQIKGKMIIGRDDSDSNFQTSGLTGGAKTHVITEDEMPSHRHVIDSSIGAGNPIVPYAYGTPEPGAGGTNYTLKMTGTTNDMSPYLKTNYTGGNTAMSLMNPYEVANIWKRTA
jgi:hypothetical protein